jgi:hypothetical protein
MSIQRHRSNAMIYREDEMTVVSPSTVVGHVTDLGGGADRIRHVRNPEAEIAALVRYADPVGEVIASFATDADGPVIHRP